MSARTLHPVVYGLVSGSITVAALAFVETWWLAFLVSVAAGMVVAVAARPWPAPRRRRDAHRASP